MSERLRIFVSSAMQELASERDLVHRRLKDFNFEPVDAETWGASNSVPWDRIECEIESCRIFVLILGEKYGWIPTVGPHGNSGLSVTHLEYRCAKKLGLPILAFFKDISADVDRETEEAEKCDAFRKEVSDWGVGHVIRRFRLAYDLADGVGRSIVDLLTESFYRQRVSSTQSRTSEMKASRTAFSPLASHRDVQIPQELINAVKNKRAVLFAGAGVSLLAGLPSAAALAERLASEVRKLEPEYSVSPSGATFTCAASDVVTIYGQERAVHVLRQMIDSEGQQAPTYSHHVAVQLFDEIITTNYDTLFEHAATPDGTKHVAVIKEPDEKLSSGQQIIHLHGSLSDPESIVITEIDQALYGRTHRRMLEVVQRLLKDKVLVVVGSSLRDPSIIQLLSLIPRSQVGYYVVPELWGFTPTRVKRNWNLESIALDSDTFFYSLSQAISSGVH